jgi:hypothetical protein
MRNVFMCACAFVACVGWPGAAAAQTANVDPRAPVTSVGALSSRFEPQDRIYVRRTSGQEIEGRYSHASDASLTVVVDGHVREIPAADVQRVSRRGGNRVKQGMLFGFLSGAAVGIAAMTTSYSESPELSRGDMMFFGAVVGGGVGLTWGGIIGAFVHEHPVVYRAAAPTARVMPMVAPGRAGVTLALRF